MKVFIDAGHGGTDPGAIGFNTKEKDITLAVSLKLEKHLKRHNIEVLLSRENDKTLSLAERSNIANRNNVNASISIHCNAFNGSAKGVETYTHGTGKNEIRLAECVHTKILESKLYNANRGIKQGNLHMVREPAMAAILIELAFIDNKEDNNLLLNKQEEFAIAIAKGILQYFNLEFKEEKNNAIKVEKPVQNNFQNSFIVRIETDVLNVRAGAGVSYNVVTTVKRNAVFTIVEEKNGWGKLKSGAGWICLDYVKKVDNKKTIKIGSKVQVNQAAKTYYNSSKKIPNWVKQNTYTAEDIKSDNILLKEIKSRVYIKDINLL